MLLKHRLACAAAVALCTVSTWVSAGIVQVGVRAYAGDFPSRVPFIDSTDGSLACCLTTASRTVTAVAGDATATSLAQADSLNGTQRQKVSASVAASRYVVGRNSGGASLANMEGIINLMGPVPGLATFTAVLQGTYNIVTPVPFNFQDLNKSVKHGVGRAQHLQSFRPTLSPDRFA